MTGRYYAADGKSYCKTMNSTGTAFKLSEDRHSVSCEEVSIKLLDATSLTYKVTFSAPPTLTLSFTFKATVPLFQAIDNSFPSRPSKILFNKDVDADGGVHAQFIPKAEVFEGLAILDGRAVDISGSGMLVYALQNKPQCAKYWNFVNFQNETDAITMYEVKVARK